mmetsp:Transcript_34059/g.87319  ORF Transcript_34059/g.87319 Transcript_34059/m.87319 type:complete len:275 (-) Transcript_34059:102-926(-)
MMGSCGSGLSRLAQASLGPWRPWQPAARAAWSSAVSRVAPPHPEWQPGVKQPPPFRSSTWVPIDPAKVKTCYPLMISAYVPRPIALISSMSADGVGNVAPYSYSGCVGHDPPAIAISINNKGAGGPVKDSANNILATKEFVVNIMSDWYVEAANHTCGNFDPDVNEMELAGLTPQPSTCVRPPRVGESAVQFECRLIHTHEMTNKQGEVTSTLVVGEVVMFHIHEECLDLEWGEEKPKVKFEALRPISRLGGDTYGVTTQVFDLPRPDRPARGR